MSDQVHREVTDRIVGILATTLTRRGALRVWRDATVRAGGPVEWRVERRRLLSWQVVGYQAVLRG